jgi:Ni,Fe-hydrogenase III component G
MLVLMCVSACRDRFTPGFVTAVFEMCKPGERPNAEEVAGLLPMAVDGERIAEVRSMTSFPPHANPSGFG